MRSTTRWATAIAWALGVAACGGPEPADGEARIAFRAHALECEIPGCAQLPDDVTCIRAKLSVTGVEGVCPLTVGPDRTVSGVCRTPAQEVRDFRLEYYTYRGFDEIQLAVVLARLDLRNETREAITLEFPQDRVMTDVFDQDQDGRTNIEEICAGTDPTVRD